MSARACEKCKAEPPGGPFNLHPYCAYCSMNLCEACRTTTPCRESPTKTHEIEED